MSADDPLQGCSHVSRFEFPVLLGDIGGTNVRLAIFVKPGGVAELLPRLLTAEFEHPSAAIGRAMGAYAGPPPRSAILAIAAAVEGLVVPMVNASWIVDARRIMDNFGLSQIMLLNDYTPVAAALVGLTTSDLTVIGPVLPPAKGPKLVLGPGTGLGVATLVPADDRFCIVSGEAGHVEFGPTNEDETAVWPHIERIGGRVTAEALLSGPGLLRLYRALAMRRGETPTLAHPSQVQMAGRAGTDRRAVEALEWFARLLGRFAGDMALILNAGAIYIASGIAPRMIEELSRGNFRDAFERKAPHETLMRRTPTWVVVNPEPALLGLAMIATDPRRFIFEAHSFDRESRLG